MIKDLSFALRMLRKSPGFTAVAVLSLALGIGANTAIFQLIDAVRLRTLPDKAPHELAEVRIADMKGARGGISERSSVTNLIWEQIRERQQAFSGIFAWGTDSANLAPGGEVRPQRGENTKLGRVGPDYFKTLKIPLLAGREFDARDTAGAPRVAIVNEAFAGRFLNRASPVGHRFRIAAMADSPETLYEIVGLVRDTKYRDLREEFVPIAYTAPAQDPRSGPGGQVLIRSRLPQAETVEAVKRVLNEVNPAITVSFQGFKPMIEASILRERLMATLSGFFSLLALLLASIGLYGILSYGVASRTKEIGIRMALGAQSSEVLSLVLREAFLLVLVGLAVGLPIVFAATRFASTLLFGLTPTDPLSLSVAALLLFAVALAAGYLPARRATRVDPLVALRYE